MHFLLFFLVAICGRLSNAVTSTKINYLPNGQVGGYELIINNTVQPRVHPPLPRDRVSKILKQTSNFGSAFTRVDEQVIGDNSYLNVHSVLKQQIPQMEQQVRMKYPVKKVLMVPSVRSTNGVLEDVKLRFAQIGPYAALIVPTNKSERSADSGLTFPPEIRDSVNAYIEVQESSTSPAQSSQKTKTGYAFAPTTYKYPPSTEPFSPLSNPIKNPQQAGKTGNYIYPVATQSSPTPATPEIGNDSNNGFVVRVVTPAKGDPNSQDSGNKYQEFFVPARPDQLEPNRDDKIIGNPFKYSGSSGPSTSQFGEVYSKENPATASYPSSEYSGRTNEASSTDQLPELAADLKDPVKASVEGNMDIGKSAGPVAAGKNVDSLKGSDSGHFQSGWSLVETQDPDVGYNPFSGPPPGQPEFSDVSPDSDPINVRIEQSSLNTYDNEQSPNLRDSSGSDTSLYNGTTKQPFTSETDLISEEEQTSDAGASSSASQLETFGPSTDVKNIPEVTTVAPISTQSLFEQDTEIGDSANRGQPFNSKGSDQQFHGPSAETGKQVPSQGFNFPTDSVEKSHQNQDDTTFLNLEDKSVEAAAESARTESDRFQENNFMHLPNMNPASPSSGSRLEPEGFKGTSLGNVDQEPEGFKGTSLGNVGQSANSAPEDTADEQFGRFQGTRPSFEQFSNDGSGSAGQFTGTTLGSDGSSSATSVLQFDENLGTTPQSNDAATVTTSPVEQFNQFQDNSATKFGQSDLSASNLPQFRIFQGGTGQNLGHLANEGFKSAVSNQQFSDQQFKHFQGAPDQTFGRVSSDSSTAAHSVFQPKQLQDITGKNLDRIPQRESALVTGDSAQRLNQLQSQKEGQILNTGHRNVGLTTIHGSRKLPFLDNEKFQKFIQDPSLTTQLRFLSPTGQTTAVLTSTGNSATVELPSEASLSGQYSGNIVIPKAIFPLPISGGGTSAEYKDTAFLDFEYNQQGTAFPSVPHHHNSFDGLQSVQNDVIGSSTNLGSLQQSNFFDSTVKDFKTVPNLEFDPAAAAAAAVAAVEASNAHFNRFDSAENLQTNQILVSDTVNINHQLQPYETISGARKPVLPGFRSPETGVSAFSSAAANDNKHIFTNLNSSGEFSDYKDQIRNKNVMDEHNKRSNAQSTNLPTFANSQFSEDEVEFKEGHLSSQFHKDATSSEDLNFRTQEPVGDSHMNFLAPGVRSDAALLSAPNGHSVNVHVPEPYVRSRPRGKIAIPKYGIPAEIKARNPINLQTGSLALHDRYASSYGRHVTPAIRQYNEFAGVRIVPSRPSPIIVVPHTEGILKTLNGLVTVPKRQLPIPAAT